MNEDLLGGWIECGASVRDPAVITQRIEALEVGETAVLGAPLGAGFNAPATQAARSGKRLGRTFRWRRSPEDEDSVEVKRIK